MNRKKESRRNTSAPSILSIGSYSVFLIQSVALLHIFALKQFDTYE